MNSQNNEEGLRERARNNPGQEPRPEVEADLQHRLLTEARQKERNHQKNRIKFFAPWVGGVAVAFVAALILSNDPDAKRALQDTLAQEETVIEPLRQEPGEKDISNVLATLDVNAQRLPSGEAIIVRDLEEKGFQPLIVSDNKTFFQIKDGKMTPLFTALETLGIEAFNDERASGQAQDEKFLYFSVNNIDKGTLVCLLNRETGELKRVHVEPSYYVNLHTAYPSGGGYQLVASLFGYGKQKVIAINGGTGAQQKILEAEMGTDDKVQFITYDKQSDSLLLPSAKRIAVWKAGQLQTIAENKDPNYRFLSVTYGVVYYDDGPGSRSGDPNAPTTYYTGTNHVRAYNLRTGENDILLPELTAQQKVTVLPGYGRYYMISVFLPNDPSAAGGDPAKLRTLPGKLQLWSLDTEKKHPPKLAYERDSTWELSHMFFNAEAGKDTTVLAPLREAGGKIAPWKVTSDHQTGEIKDYK